MAFPENANCVLVKLEHPDPGPERVGLRWVDEEETPTLRPYWV
jgi:hypothetical protein